ncbi:MAG: hypothetical protein H0V27_12175 [Pyrinomonadaceae bacterium]|nr:hypothetical protein [Pyrinomonadaceae bacterium]
MTFVNDENSHSKVRRRSNAKTALLATLIVCGLAVVAVLSRVIDSTRVPYEQTATEESLYVSPGALKRMSLGFNGLVADYYWLRTIQYVGRKIMAHEGPVPLGDLRALDLRALAPLLERTVTLDPQFVAAYEYGAIILPGVDVEKAIDLTKRGIEANPQAWRLYHHLGYIYWQAGRFDEASAAYAAGANVANAPRWMRLMSARMQAEGGSRETARAMYTLLYEEASDQGIRDMALNYLHWLRSLDERDTLRRMLGDFQRRTGKCPGSWRETKQDLRADANLLRFDQNGTPVDPSGVAYRIDPNVCEAILGSTSKIARR